MDQERRRESPPSRAFSTRLPLGAAATCREGGALAAAAEAAIWRAWWAGERWAREVRKGLRNLAFVAVWHGVGAVRPGEPSVV